MDTLRNERKLYGVYISPAIIDAAMQREKERGRRGHDFFKINRIL